MNIYHKDDMHPHPDDDVVLSYHLPMDWVMCDPGNKELRDYYLCTYAKKIDIEKEEKLSAP